MKLDLPHDCFASAIRTSVILFDAFTISNLTSSVIPKSVVTSNEGVLWGQSWRGRSPEQTRAVDADTMVDCWSLGEAGYVDSDGSMTNVVPFHLMPTYRFRLRKRVPVFPEWLIQGLVGRNGLYNAEMLKCDSAYEAGTTGSLTLATAQWISDADTVIVRKNPSSRAAFLPLETLFSEGHAKPLDRSPVWYAEAALFVRWGLYAPSLLGKPIHRDAFWRFVAQATSGPVTEKTFRDCFGFGYAEMESELASYLPVAVNNLITRDVDIDLDPKLPKLRDATPSEVGRIIGDWERIEGDTLKVENPELSREFLKQASKTLLKPYNDGSRDPQLLGALGLYEFPIDRELSGKHLQGAADGHIIRPTVYTRLAQLRFDAAQSHPAGSEGKLSDDQLASVLGPLFTARQQPPALVETYRLMAKAWSQSAIKPTKEHLAVLDEGMALFWPDKGLADDVNALRSQWGYHGLTASEGLGSVSFHPR
jgi:hypothetical protein